ncbi:MAG: SMI1/KNR4 family protein [Hyphomicrobiaceae bacterium]
MPSFADDTPPLPAPSQARIERLEASFEQTFPPAYLEFIRQHNGANLSNSVCTTPFSEVV